MALSVMVTMIASVDWLVGKVTELLLMVYWDIGEANWEKEGCWAERTAGGMSRRSRNERMAARGR